MSKGGMNSTLRTVFLAYFITHIPISLVLDFQALLGAYYPPILKSLYSWYTAQFQDHLMATKPLWLQSFILAEVILQFPLFFFFIRGLMKKEYHKIKIPGIIYGAHVATTVWAILAETIISDKNSTNEKIILTSFYFPYFLVPVLFALSLSSIDESKAKSV